MLLHPFILEIEELAVPDNDDAECSISSSSSADQSLFESWNEDYSWDDNPLQLLQEQELDYCIDDVDYLSSSSHKENVIVTPANRRVMCNWCYKIAELSSVDNVVVCIAMSYLDRFMATSLSDHNNNSSTVARRALGCRHEYQLAVVTCLFIAMKLRGKWQFGADTIATEICSGMYTKEEIEIMELEILHALSWRLNGPTAHDFIIAMVNLLPRNSNNNNSSVAPISTLVQLANDHIEAAILDYEMALQPSSRLAYVALLASLQRSDVTIDAYFDPTDLITWTNTIDNNMWFKKVCIAVEQGSTILRPTTPLLLPPTSISLTGSYDDNDATTSDDDISSSDEMRTA
jgi:hypothetical protein